MVGDARGLQARGRGGGGVVAKVAKDTTGGRVAWRGRRHPLNMGFTTISYY